MYDKNSHRTHKRSSFNLADKVTQQALQPRQLKQQPGARESRNPTKAEKRQNPSPYRRAEIHPLMTDLRSKNQDKNEKMFSRQKYSPSSSDRKGPERDDLKQWPKE